MTWFLAVMILTGGEWQHLPLAETDVPTQFESQLECSRAMRFVTTRVLTVGGVAGVQAQCVKLRPA